MKKGIFRVIVILIISLVSLSAIKIALATAKSMSHVFGSGTTLKGIFKINATLKEENTKGTISYATNSSAYSVKGKISSIIVSDNKANFRVESSDALIVFGNQVYPDSYVEGFVVDANGSGDRFSITFCKSIGLSYNGSPDYTCMTDYPSDSDTFITSGNITINTKPISIPNSSPQLLPLTSPTPQGDTQPPVFENITGPADGSTIDFNSFCFLLTVKDNVSTGITVRYSFDNSGVSEWNQNYSPCYSNVSNGFHFFVVQARDAAGNTSGFVSRNFTVQVN